MASAINSNPVLYTRTAAPAPAQAAAAPAAAAGAPEATDTASKLGSKTTAAVVKDKKGDLQSALRDQWKTQGYEESKAKVGDYAKKGENSTIEGALKAKGYSLKEIYTKDKNGLSLADQVAQANGLKDAKHLQAGMDLNIPGKKAEKAGDKTGDKAPAKTEQKVDTTPQKIASKGLAPGGDESLETRHGDNSAAITMERSEDGTAIRSASTVTSGEASMEARTLLGADGRIEGSTRKTANGGVKINQTAQNGNGTAATRLNMRAHDGETHVLVRDTDGNANSQVLATENGITMYNPGARQSGVGTRIAVGPQSWTEALGKEIDGWAPELLRQQTSTAPFMAAGVQKIEGVSHQDGSATYQVRRDNGSSTYFQQSERGVVQGWGKSLNDAFTNVSRYLSDAPAATATPAVLASGD